MPARAATPTDLPKPASVTQSIGVRRPTSDSGSSLKLLSEVEAPPAVIALSHRDPCLAAYLHAQHELSTPQLLNIKRWTNETPIQP
ncbi:hypothetical protein SNOG_09374 [Parastagonospora nodorum SN15]|uniref:Uncharacterized protein n=1 Tax=Phaeosphaeria nodorum (strain SN15 / ATCC MYA-4574 / FGSC 10173) TaxID=321614 RepID=Q0UFU0_PHANO|nr:hypothetical protein SNOG_09374 [Parastagonospora nodorum SN15]EAT83566.1 hypothetical protein SNOG_09374 [Parastagonospora nodorum SN15]